MNWQPTSLPPPKWTSGPEYRRDERFSSCQLVEQRLGLLEIERVEPFGESAVD
jgi:hypothetical protein